MDDVFKTMRKLEYLQRRDIGVAVDDFGTGYSSLSYLTDLKPTVIEIGHSFINPGCASIRNDKVLEAILFLGHYLKATMLAEGIGTPSISHGCATSAANLVRVTTFHPLCRPAMCQANSENSGWNLPPDSRVRSQPVSPVARKSLVRGTFFGLGQPEDEIGRRSAGKASCGVPYDHP